jgi:hypothetical protein
MFKKFPRDWRWYTPFLWIPFAAVAMLALAQIPWPHSLLEWQGTKAPVDVLSSVVTPITALVAVVGLIINGRSANRTFELSRTSQLISTFQKAAEMMNSGAESTSSAGIALMQEIAYANPALKVPVLETLEAYISERDQTDWNAAPENFSAPSIHSVPSSRGSCLRAIRCASFIHFPGATKPLVINRPYLARYSVPEDSTFGALHISNARIHFFTFFGSYFTGSTFVAEIGENVIFDGCRFAGASFHLTDLSGQAIEPEQSDRVAFINTADHTNFSINGIAFEQWQERASPPPRRDRNGHIIPEAKAE